MTMEEGFSSPLTVMTFKFDTIEVGKLLLRDFTHESADTAKGIREILDKIVVLQQGVNHMNAQITAFKDAVDAQFVAVNSGLDNIVADEASLATSIADLKAQIAAGSSVLSTEDQAALDGVLATAVALVTRTKAVADAVPDTVPVPVV